MNTEKIHRTAEEKWDYVTEKRMNNIIPFYVFNIPQAFDIGNRIGIETIQYIQFNILHF